MEPNTTNGMAIKKKALRNMPSTKVAFSLGKRVWHIAHPCARASWLAANVSMLDTSRYTIVGYAVL